MLRRIYNIEKTGQIFLHEFNFTNSNKYFIDWIHTNGHISCSRVN